LKLDRKGPPQPGEASRPPGTKPPRKPKHATEPTEPPSGSGGGSAAAAAPRARPSPVAAKPEASSSTPKQSTSSKRPRPDVDGDAAGGRDGSNKVARRGEGSEEKTTDAKTMLATLDTTQLSSVLAGLDAGVELADITAEVRRRLAAGGGGDAAGAPVAKIQEKKKKKKKSKKEKKISKKEKKDK
jgi:hypothetical protein